jgi:hypothetical protein
LFGQKPPYYWSSEGEIDQTAGSVTPPSRLESSVAQSIAHAGQFDYEQDDGGWREIEASTGSEAELESTESQHFKLCADASVKNYSDTVSTFLSPFFLLFSFPFFYLQHFQLSYVSLFTISIRVSVPCF